MNEVDSEYFITSEPLNFNKTAIYFYDKKPNNNVANEFFVRIFQDEFEL